MEYALVVQWLVALGALWLLGLPVAARLFPTQTGRGAGLALPVALVALTLPAYYVGHLTFGPVALAAGVLTLVAASALTGLDRQALREGSLVLDVDVDGAALRDAVLVFVLAFGFLVAVRAVDPAVHPGGGEKFLDFGLVKSLFLADALPPEDFWFAGEPVAYYYGGHLVSTLLAWLSGVPPRFAYNLALATFYAALVTSVFDLAGAVAGDRGVSRRAAGAIAAFVVGVASNLATASTVVLGYLPDSVARTVAQGVAARSRYTVDTLLSGGEGFSYWTASRVIPGTINEFPLFAWLNGDLHAHMMGTPFLVLAAALAYAFYRTPPGNRGRRAGLAFVALPLVAALQAVVDTWSFPTLFGLLWLAATFAPGHPLSLVPGAERTVADAVQRSEGLRAVADSRLGTEVGRAVGALAVAGVAGVVAAVLAAPFLLATASGPSRAVDVLAPAQRSTLDALFLVHGAFVVAFGWYLADRFRGRRLSLLLGVGALAFVAVRIDFAVLALAAPLLVVGWVALRFDRPAGFETALVVAGAGLITLVEVVYVVEQAGPLRMNTVFKTYMQVWVLWSLAAGVALADVLRLPARTDVAVPSSFGGALRGESSVAGTVDAVGARPLATGVVVLLLLSTSVYGALALNQHFANAPDPTLDATAFVGERHPEEAPAIAWLDAREGQPTIASAPGTTVYFGPGNGPSDGVAYTWDANPASSLTGKPTVAGWRHEIGYRGDEAYFERVRDVDTFFTGTRAERSSFLAAYGVEYVWVGPAERDRYGDVRVADHPALSVAFSDGSVTVYRVDESAL